MIFNTFKLLLALGIGYVFVKFVLIALYRLHFYKKQGLRTQFSPLIGSYFMQMQKWFKKENDALHDFRVLPEKEPKIKALVRNFGATPVLILLDPAIKQQFAFQHELYEVSDMFGEIFKVFTTGLVGVNGAEWRKQRKIISQSFHFECIKDNLPVIVNTTREHIKRISEENLKDLNLLTEMEKMAGDIVTRFFFSENLKNYQVRGKPVGSYTMETLENIGKCFISVGYLLFGPKYVEKGFWKSHRDAISDVRLLEETCRKILNDRKKANIPNKDLAWYLIESQKEKKEEDRLSDQIIIANFITFIMAGTNTTAQLVTMTIYALALHPEMLAKLREEIKQGYNTESEPITVDSLQKMNWLTAILKETLRVYNPASFGPTFKSATKDHALGDLNIKKGTIVGVASMYTFSHAQYFANPDEFNPQRWIDRPNVSEPYVYTPFWGGPRNCIGQHLALLEARIILCEFVKTFDFSVGKDYVLKMNAMRGYAPEGGLRMDLKLRGDSI